VAVVAEDPVVVEEDNVINLFLKIIITNRIPI
jgi:hypothetical protein